jgi:hypothetical protein
MVKYKMSRPRPKIVIEDEPVVYDLEFYNKIRDLVIDIGTRKYKHPIEEEKKFIFDVCKNNIEDKIPNFMDFFLKVVQHDAIIIGYINAKQPMTLLCNKLHETNLTRPWVNDRIKRGQLPCSTCGGDSRKINARRTAQIADSTQKSKEWVVSKGGIFVSYSDGEIALNCPTCGEICTVPTSTISSKIWKECKACKEKKREEKQVVILIKKQPVYEVEIYNPKEDDKNDSNELCFDCPEIPLNIDLTQYFSYGKFLIPKSVANTFKTIVPQKKLVDHLCQLSGWGTILFGKEAYTMSDSKMKKGLNTLRNTTYTIVENEIKAIATVGNVFLNYFTLNIIMNVRRINSPSFVEKWNDVDFRSSIWTSIIAHKSHGKDITTETLIQHMKQSFTRAYNFPANVAKAVYNHFKAEHVLDFCSGFGGRLLGFYFSDAKTYVGIDPNKNINYEEMVPCLIDHGGRDNKHIRFVRSRAENYDYNELKYPVDLVFTSPPYFNLEIYSEDKEQSCNRYPKYNDWKEKFLFTVLKKVTSYIIKGGHLAINIKNISNVNIADDMNIFLRSMKEYEEQQPIIIGQPHINVGTEHEQIYVYKKLTESVFGK